jgi:glutathionyl-hydroquinone reductase
VYKTGVAQSQSAHEAAVVPLFDSLDRLEKMLTGKEFLIGDRLTEADIRLYVTIVCFLYSFSSIMPVTSLSGTIDPF